MHRPVQVAHSSFIEGSHMTKNKASGITTIGIVYRDSGNVSFNLRAFHLQTFCHFIYGVCICLCVCVCVCVYVCVSLNMDVAMLGCLKCVMHGGPFL